MSRSSRKNILPMIYPWKRVMRMMWSEMFQVPFFTGKGKCFELPFQLPWWSAARGNNDISGRTPADHLYAARNKPFVRNIGLTSMSLCISIGCKRFMGRWSCWCGTTGKAFKKHFLTLLPKNVPFVYSQTGRASLVIAQPWSVFFL